jgi:hypothetical protein
VDAGLLERRGFGLYDLIAPSVHYPENPRSPTLHRASSSLPHPENSSFPKEFKFPQTLTPPSGGRVPAIHRSLQQHCSYDQLPCSIVPQISLSASANPWQVCKCLISCFFFLARNHCLFHLMYCN